MSLWLEFKHLISRKCIYKLSPAKCRPNLIRPKYVITLDANFVITVPVCVLETNRYRIPEGKVHVANMVPIRGRHDPGGPHVGPMNFAVWDNLWLTVNNCFVTREAVRQWFSRVTKSWVKTIFESPHEWQKPVSMVAHTLFYFLHALLFPKHKNPLKTIIDRAHFAIVAKDVLFWLSIVTSPQVTCEVTRRRGIGIVTSYSSIILARINWRKVDLH